MKQRSKPTLVWLEDIPKTAEEIFYSVEEEFIVEQIEQLDEFEEILNDPSHKVKGIVLDVMLYGVHDLTELGIEKEVDTDMGADAGWCVLEHYLRAPESKFRKIPVLVLSFRSLKKENEKLMARLTQAGDAPITFIEKRGRDKKDNNGEGILWTKQFADWINNDVRKRKLP